jgi:hypothetical protein
MPIDPSTSFPTTPGQEASYAIQLKILEAKAKQADQQAAILERQIKDKKLSKAAIAAAQKRLAAVKGAARTAWMGHQKVQNKIYEVTGQYDKLLTGSDRDAFTALNSLFSQYDLGSLAGKIFDYVKNGYSSDTISILLQDTKEYKERFIGNEERKKKGMGVLSPAEYLSVESSYRQIMQQGGMPLGFYDDKSDFSKFIGGDMSPTELQSRVNQATQATTLANPEYKKALNQMGISDADLAAYWLDPKKALPMLEKSAATAAIGAEALRKGLQFDPNYAENLATQGVTREQAAAGYTQLGAEYGGLKGLAGIYGGNWNQRMAEQAAFEGNVSAGEQRKKLIQSEQGSFAGQAGAARGGLAQSGGAR